MSSWDPESTPRANHSDAPRKAGSHSLPARGSSLATSSRASSPTPSSTASTESEPSVLAKDQPSTRSRSRLLSTTAPATPQLPCTDLAEAGFKFDEPLPEHLRSAHDSLPDDVAEIADKLCHAFNARWRLEHAVGATTARMLLWKNHSIELIDSACELRDKWPSDRLNRVFALVRLVIDLDGKWKPPAVLGSLSWLPAQYKPANVIRLHEALWSPVNRPCSGCATGTVKPCLVSAELPESSSDDDEYDYNDDDDSYVDDTRCYTCYWNSRKCSIKIVKGVRVDSSEDAAAAQTWASLIEEQRSATETQPGKRDGKRTAHAKKAVKRPAGSCNPRASSPEEEEPWQLVFEDPPPEPQLEMEKGSKPAPVAVDFYPELPDVDNEPIIYRVSQGEHSRVVFGPTTSQDTTEAQLGQREAQSPEPALTAQLQQLLASVESLGLQATGIAEHTKRFGETVEQRFDVITERVSKLNQP
ncbi:hypothetical protein AURDEDRAFT_161029 [Auricularia subglabra TFB-10046 SS5]|nr:hypothetical protein AURDEDRAFT_161029 [Auricularia subglabra TFB-10046 SS5]